MNTRKSVIIIILLLISFIQIKEVKINNKNIKEQIHTRVITNTKREQEKIEEPIAILKIPKINLYRNLYRKESNKNNIEENVTILKESTENHLILAAHSGNSMVSFFNRLDELNLEDSIYIDYKGQTNEYFVTKIKEVLKNGKLFLVQDENKMKITLTTCSRNHEERQLIITGIKK